MKKILVVLSAAMLLSGCAKPMKSGGREIPTYGLLNEDDSRDKDACYRISAPAVIAGIILVETVIAPIYMFGFSMYEPVGMKVKGKCLTGK